MTPHRRRRTQVTAKDVATAVVRLAGEVGRVKRRLAKLEGAKPKIGFEVVDVRGEGIEKDEADEDEFGDRGNRGL